MHAIEKSADKFKKSREKHEKKEHKKHEKKESKVGVVLKEFKNKKLHSSSKKGPLVKNKSQALAIGLSEARKAGEHIKKKK